MQFEQVFPFFLIGFPVLWLFLTGVISFIGGWYFLAKAHPASERLMEQGREFGFQSVYIGLLGGYRSCVSVTVLDGGILLRTFILYRFMHRPIFLPWDRMTDHREANILFVKRISFMVGGKKIAISGRSVEEIWKKVRGAH